MATQDTIEEIKKVQLYYMEFHHKCVGWYITIMGFFIAGAIASSAPIESTRYSIGLSIILFSVILSVLFFLCIFHYSARIKKLGLYLEKPDSITTKWHENAKKARIVIHGQGSRFFFSIIIAMQAAVIWLTIIKYLS